MRLLTFSLVLFLFSSNCFAEPVPKWNGAKAQNVANWISNGLVVFSIGSDAFNTFKNTAHSSSKKKAAINFSLRVGISVLASELVKHNVSRTRPDGSDNKSFWSEHTSLTCATSNWQREWLNIAQCGSVAYFRMAANKHYPTDTLFGGLSGRIAKELVNNDW